MQLKRRRKSKVQLHKSTLALLVIVVAIISSATTSLSMYYWTLHTGSLSSAHASSAIDSKSIYANARQGVAVVEGSQVTISPYGRDTSEILGSGFVINENGTTYVVTNYHVVEGTRDLAVTFYDGNGYAAKVVGDDPYSDLAVLSVPDAGQSEFHPLSFARSQSVVVGEPVLAIGNPYGLAGSLTIGIVSQLGRTIQESEAGNFSIADMIQFSAPTNPGNSGGPLLNSDGRVIGITTAVVTDSQGVGFAIPSDTIMRELPYLIKTGTYRLHPYIGIVGADMNYQLAEAIRTNVTYGVLVQQVVQDSPAKASGLRGGTHSAAVQGQQYILGGDIIISIDGKKIQNNDDLATYLEENEVAGQQVQLGIVRSGTTIIVPLVLGVRPPPPTS
jgi:S1-C subfamily serine protease